jgi:hypothetical protein
MLMRLNHFVTATLSRRNAPNNKELREHGLRVVGETMMIGLRSLWPSVTGLCTVPWIDEHVNKPERMMWKYNRDRLLYFREFHAYRHVSFLLILPGQH